MTKSRITKNGLPTEITASNVPDKVDEITFDEEYYYCWETPGTFVGKIFTEDTTARVLIMHVVKSETQFTWTVAKAKWTDRTTAAYAPLSQREVVLAQ